MKLEGLRRLSICLKEETDYNLSETEVAYFIRHLSIASGCKNCCVHCFSDASSKVRQTSIIGFSKMIKEIGSVIKNTGKNLDFFHLGADSDPAYVKDYAAYLSEWINSFPMNYPIKIFTHCWNLENDEASKEFNKVLQLLTSTEIQNVRFVISFDEFSIMARRNWQAYINNLAINFQEIVKCIGKDNVRIEVFYAPQVYGIDERLKLQYWRDYSVDHDVEFSSIIRLISNQYSVDTNASKTTLGLFQVFEKTGLRPKDLWSMSRDCGIIFPAGRGRLLFTSDTAKSVGLDIQEKKVLYSLKDYKYKYYGLIIYPDGSARLVDYKGFKLGKWLNKGMPIIDYMRELK